MPTKANSSILLGYLFAVLALVSCVNTPAGAAKPTVNSKSLAANNSSEKKRDQNQPAVDAETERVARELVEAHLPSLKEILRRLHDNEPAEYAKAVRELARSARRLEIAQGRSERAFEIELELLQAQTEVNLLTARLRVRDNPRDRKQLRSAVARLQAAQIARANDDVQVLRERLARTEKQLELAQQRLQARQKNAAEQLEKTYSSLLRKAGRDADADSLPRTTRNQNTKAAADNR